MWSLTELNDTLWFVIFSTQTQSNAGLNPEHHKSKWSTEVCEFEFIKGL